MKHIIHCYNRSVSEGQTFFEYIGSVLTDEVEGDKLQRLSKEKYERCNYIDVYSTTERKIVLTREVHPVDLSPSKNFLEFIKYVETSYFRTNQDTGANENALFIWNRVRQYAGLPQYEKSDLPAYCHKCQSWHPNPCQKEPNK